MQVRTITFNMHWKPDAVGSFNKPIIGDDEMVKWVTEQFAYVNDCRVTATENGKQIAEADKPDTEPKE